MENSQRYIGADNGVLLCIDGRTDGGFAGRLYHRYEAGELSFLSIEQLAGLMESFFDRLGNPMPSTGDRDFIPQKPVYPKKKELMRMKTDEELLQQHGNLGSFVVRVQHRQNSSWQGQVTWLEQDRTVYFRSAWELMKLLDHAIPGSVETEWIPGEEKED